MSTALAAWPQQRWQPQTPAQSRSPAPRQARELSIGDELLRQLGELASGDLRHAKRRARAIEWILPMTVYLASRFRGRSEPLTDLTQVAGLPSRCAMRQRRRPRRRRPVLTAARNPYPSPHAVTDIEDENMTHEFDQIPGRHRWDPLVDAEQQLMSRQLSPVAVSDEDEADTSTAAAV
jgi:hypothetical protein